MRKKNEIFQKVQLIIRQCSDEELKKINMEDSFRENLGFDSVQMVNFQICLEDEFEFIFDPIEDDFEEIFKRVKNVCDYLERLLN